MFTTNTDLLHMGIDVHTLSHSLDIDISHANFSCDSTAQAFATSNVCMMSSRRLSPIRLARIRLLFPTRAAYNEFVVWSR
jgi:hypothetical protein